MVNIYVDGKNKSRHHAFTSGKHTKQNAARCRDMLQHPWLYDSCTANASLCNIVSVPFAPSLHLYILVVQKSLIFLVSVLFMEHELGIRLLF